MGDFPAGTKCASCSLSQICQDGKDLISAYWGVRRLPPSLSPYPPASQGKSPQRGSPKSRPWLCPLVYPGVSQRIFLSQHQYSSLRTKFGAYKAQQRIQVTPSSLLCNVRSFSGQKSLCSRSRRDQAMLSERARAPRVTGSIVPCSSGLSLQGCQGCSKASEAGGGQPRP